MLVDLPRLGREATSVQDTSVGPRYRLSFTSGGLLVREAAVVADRYLARRDWSEVRDEVQRNNLLQARTVTSAQRTTREVTQRLSELSDDEIELLADTAASERAHLLWVAACRRYEFIGEFAEEVLRERFIVLAGTLRHDEFDSFVRRKALWHTELAALKDSTLTKLRSNVFRMLREAELVSEAGQIVPALLSERLASLLRDRTPSDVRFFPTQLPEGRDA